MANREAGGRAVVFGGRDIREKGKKGGGSGGGDGGREEPVGKKRGKEICSLCMGVCCGMARELVANLASMGEVGGSGKVRCSYSVKLILRFVGCGIGY